MVFRKVYESQLYINFYLELLRHFAWNFCGTHPNAHTTSAAVSRLPRLVKTLKSNPMKKLILFLLFCIIITSHHIIWFKKNYISYIADVDSDRHMTFSIMNHCRPSNTLDDNNLSIYPVIL